MRLDHLSARVEKFGAYSSALEDFVDEHGTVSELFDRIDEDVTDLETRIDGTNEELSAEIDDVRENADDLATEIEHVRDDVGSMREEIATLTSEVRELRSMRESLAAVLAGQDASDESDPVSTSGGPTPMAAHSRRPISTRTKATSPRRSLGSNPTRATGRRRLAF